LALLGSIELAQGRPEIAADHLARALRAAPDHPILQVNLGEACRRAGRIDEAFRYLRRAVVLLKESPEAHYNLAMACSHASLWTEAVKEFETALRLRPDIDAEGNYREALVQSGNRDGAIAYQRRIVAQQPGHAAAHYELGMLLMSSNDPDQAIPCFERAHRLAPTHRETLVRLASAFVLTGSIDDAVRTFDRIVALGANSASDASQRLFLLQYHPSYDARAIAEEAKAWRHAYVESAGIVQAPHVGVKRRDKRLRIGYVSSHFETHVSCFFTLPLFRNHRHEDFEIFCYSNVRTADRITEMHRKFADHWRDVAPLSEEEIAVLIRRDGIDILVDLTMHASEGRPLIFAYKPAPIQMCWLAYPGTTGLTEIDYRISDACIDPPSSDTSVYSERTLRLPDSFWCFDPAAPGLEVNALPCREKGLITFACLNSFVKINAAVLELWARVLHRVPRSKLLLQAPPGGPRDRTLASLAKSDIGPERVDFVGAMPREKYFACYHQCDIGLDAFPYNGHTTSLDAMWMGVPVVTLLGTTAPGRGGASIAMNVDMPELIAKTPDAYVDIAAALAANTMRLGDLRASLRAKMTSSPLMDAPRFARNFEQLYRRAWRAYCDGERLEG
jgi:predicted O-linked N-acetylglucosamine transferase (SPINDLY family)